MFRFIKSTKNPLLLVAFIALLSWGCADDDACSITAETTADKAEQEIYGGGTIKCDKTKSVQMKVCIQSNAGGQFEDMLCENSSKSDSNLANYEIMAMCIAGSPTKYRTRVIATIDGVEQGEKISAQTSCE